MIGVDTNVLVRYIVQDDLEQGAAATAFLETACTQEQPGRICLVVLCELVWVLTRAYGYERDTVSDVLEQLLLASELDIEQSGAAWRALRDYRLGPAGFSDYLIAHLNALAETEYTITLDRQAARHPLFRLLQA